MKLTALTILKYRNSWHFTDSSNIVDHFQFPKTCLYNASFILAFTTIFNLHTSNGYSTPWSSVSPDLDVKCRVRVPCQTRTPSSWQIRARLVNLSFDGLNIVAIAWYLTETAKILIIILCSVPCNGDSSHLGFSKLFYLVDPDSFQALASSQIFLAYLLNCAAIRY